MKAARVPTHPLEGAFDRVARAEKHIADFKEAELALGQVYHEKIVLDFEPDPPHMPRTTLSEQVIVGSVFSILAGEVAYNLRAALDYLVFELARHDSAKVQNGTQFPICDTKRRFDENLPRWLVGVSAANQQEIEMLQPYNGCEWIRYLRDVSNPDKHRRLAVPTFGFAERVSTFHKGSGPGAYAEQICTTRRALHPENGVEVERYLTTEVPIMIEIESTKTEFRPFVDLAEQIRVSVLETLESFKPRL